MLFCLYFAASRPQVTTHVYNFLLNDATPRITIKNNLAIKYSGPMDSRGVYSILTKDKRPAVT